MRTALPRTLAAVLILSLAVMLPAIPASASDLVVYQGSVLRNFDTSEQAQQWLDRRFPRIVLTVDSSGVIDLVNPVRNMVQDCDDYSEWLSKEAAKDGYLIAGCPVMDGTVWGIPATPLIGCHIGNMLRIGNVFYYVESSPCSSQGQLVRLLNAD